jgi:hypothetical protein
MAAKRKKDQKKLALPPPAPLSLSEKQAIQKELGVDESALVARTPIWAYVASGTLVAGALIGAVLLVRGNA